jgi:hypothetical protein
MKGNLNLYTFCAKTILRCDLHKLVQVYGVGSMATVRQMGSTPRRIASSPDCTRSPGRRVPEREIVMVQSLTIAHLAAPDGTLRVIRHGADICVYVRRIRRHARAHIAIVSRVWQT